MCKEKLFYCLSCARHNGRPLYEFPHTMLMSLGRKLYYPTYQAVEIKTQKSLSDLPKVTWLINLSTVFKPRPIKF